ncbi:MAG: tRNA lysidine(34) synthetase TilS [Candidatus Omnitrophota bacterium]
MLSTLIDKVKSTVKKYKMLEKYDKVLLGLSGGADSIVLLNVLVALKKEHHLSIHIAHLDHKFRGEESKGDRIFCENLAKDLKLDFNYEEIDIPKIVEDTGLSSEEAARKERYKFFNKVCEKNNIKKIAVAHTKDDQAETVLMRLIRGSGMSGLGAISPMKNIKGLTIIRPLIEVSREEIEGFIKENSLEYRHDSSNDSNIFTRNKVRHELLPYLEKNFNSNIKKILSNTAENLREENEFLEKLAKRKRKSISKKNKQGEIVLDIKKLKKEDLALRKRILRNALEEVKGDLRRFTYQHWKEIEALINERPTNSIVDLPSGIKVVKNQNTLVVRREK